MPPPVVPKICAVYTRQSTKSESDLTSIQVQRETCEDFIRLGCGNFSHKDVLPADFTAVRLKLNRSFGDQRLFSILQDFPCRLRFAWLKNIQDS